MTTHLNYSGDLEFHVNVDSGTTIYKAFEQAIAMAVSYSLSNNVKAYVDVVVWSKQAAHDWAGDNGVTQYQEDPDASVFERIGVRVTLEGQIP